MDQLTFNRLYMAYLEHSVRYYELDDPIIDDGLYDRLCQALLRHWAGFGHRLKHLTDESALRAGTGFHLAGHPELARVRTMIRLAGRMTLYDYFGRLTSVVSEPS